MESSAKWAPDPQPCLPRSLLLASCFFTYSCRLSSAVCPLRRVLFGATASSSCPAPGRRQREKKATQAYTIFFASHFCLFPFHFFLFTFASLLAPFPLAVSKMFPCNTKNLAITTPYRWKQPASKPLVFPSVSMADEKRISNGTHFTLPSWKHAVKCFHDVPKVFPWP